MKYFQQFFVTIFRLILSLLVVSILVACYGFYYIKYKLPDVDTLKNVELRVPLQVYTSDGKLIGEFGEQKRIPVTFDQIPPLLVKAVLATEDQRFYEHPGIDFFGLMRAVRELATTGRKEQGASTITMQVARNYFLSRKKTFSRKFNEMLLALMIDHTFTKDKILELYLNKIYLGNQAYGVEAAAQIYYGKSLKQLTLAEIAMIAGLAQAPSFNNPLINPDAALKRRNHVLERMLENNYIDEKTYDATSALPLNTHYHGPKIEAVAPYLAEMTRQAMYDKYGEDAYSGGFKVYTTVNSQIEDWARESLDDGLEAYTRRHPIPYRLPKENLGPYSPAVRQSWLIRLGRMAPIRDMQPAAVIGWDRGSVQALMANGKTISFSTAYGRGRYSTSQVFRSGNVVLLRENDKGGWSLAQPPLVEGALVSLNPNDGAILAVVGGYDYNYNKFNRAVQGELQPGSSFKPFIYSAALDQGFTLASIVNDSPVEVHIPGQKVWRPQNSDHRFLGPVRLRYALAHSRNMVSIRLLDAIGIPNAIDYITRFGFDPNRLPRNLTMALGTAQLSPLEMCHGYSVFANGGYNVTPYFIDHIIDSKNELVYKAQPRLACPQCHDIDALNPIVPPPNRMAPQAITPQNAFIMTSALQEVIRSGTGHAAQKIGRYDLAGKTGTTNDKFDAWFSGFNSDITTSVWVGFDQPHTLHEYGAQAALPIWIDFMSKVLQGKPEHTMPEPPGLVYVRIDGSSGYRAGSRSGLFEVFRAQDAPENEPDYNYFEGDNGGGPNLDDTAADNGGADIF